MDIVAQIQWGINGLLRDKNRIYDEELKKTVSFHVLLLVWEFTEEWKLIELLCKNDEHLKTTLRVVSPAVCRIRKWDKGLSRVRNQFLAHSRHRDKQGDFVPIKKIFEDPHVPTAFAEMLFLGKLAEMAMNWLCNLYPKDTKICSDWLMTQGVVKTSKGLRTLGEANDELMQVESEIKKRFRDSDLRLGNPLTGDSER